MGPDRKSFSDLLRQDIDREISRLQEHPERIVAAFDANERVAHELNLTQALGETASFLSERVGLNAVVVNDNPGPEIIDAGTMMTRLIGDRPEYVLSLQWEFDGKKKMFSLLVADSGKKVRIIQEGSRAVDVDAYKDLELDYEGVHEKISEALFKELNIDFSLLRADREERIPASTPA